MQCKRLKYKSVTNTPDNFTASCNNKKSNYHLTRKPLLLIINSAKTQIQDSENQLDEAISKIAILMKGDYISSSWHNIKINTDFYLIKGIIENLLDYLGFKNRYTFEKEAISNLHPGIGARILLDRKPIGIIGKVHPALNKDDIYVAEISLEALMTKVKPIKFKAAPKYPEIVKDLAFVMEKETPTKDIEAVIKKAGGRLLTDVHVFDVYTGSNVSEDEKSVAYNLTFQDLTRTLTEEEVTKVFNNIIEKVQKETTAKLRK